MKTSSASHKLPARVNLGRLTQSAVNAASGRASPRVPAQIMQGPVDDLLRHVAGQDREDLWRFTIITGDGHYIRGAELRALVREAETQKRRPERA